MHEATQALGGIVGAKAALRLLGAPGGWPRRTPPPGGAGAGAVAGRRAGPPRCGRRAKVCDDGRMSVLIESAWPKYPDYVIDLVPAGVTARAWFGDLLLAESEHAVRLEETKHVDRLYFPVDDVHWELFEPTPNFTICPFKGARDLLVAHRGRSGGEGHRVDLLGARSTRSPASRGTCASTRSACASSSRTAGTGDHSEGGQPVVNRFPAWGDAADLLELIDVYPRGCARSLRRARRTATPRATSSRAARCSRRASSRCRRCSRASA